MTANLPPSFIVRTHARSETHAWGERLAACAPPGLVIALRGDLGAGKTTFVQGLAAGLGVPAHVTSPTFILVNEYKGAGSRRLIHVDTYRLGDRAEDAVAAAEMVGLEDLWAGADAVVAVEWADRIAAMLPPDHLEVELSYDSRRGADVRALRFAATGPQSAAVLAALRRLDVNSAQSPADIPAE